MCREVDRRSASLPHQTSLFGNAKLLSYRCTWKYTDLRLLGAVLASVCVEISAGQTMEEYDCGSNLTFLPGTCLVSNISPVRKIQNLFSFELAAAAASGIKSRSEMSVVLNVLHFWILLALIVP